MRIYVITIGLVIIVVFFMALLAAPHSKLLSNDSHADRILIEKSKRCLTLYKENKILKTYQVALGQNAVGHKEQEGDNRTPEGLYHIDYRKSDSAFHRALHISYPNAHDIEKAKKRGVSPGGAIMIHGIPNDPSWINRFRHSVDWTDGCIAVTNHEIEEIWMMVQDGIAVEIKP